MASFPSFRRAAILLAELPADDARLLLSRLEPEEVSALAGEFSQAALAEENHRERDAALLDFAKNLKSQSQDILPAPLRSASCDELRRILLVEHPQTVAAVLTHLPRPQAVEFLATLPAMQQSELVRRIATSMPIAREILTDLLGSLEHHLIGKARHQAVDAAKRCA